MPKPDKATSPVEECRRPAGRFLVIMAIAERAASDDVSAHVDYVVYLNPATLADGVLSHLTIADDIAYDFRKIIVDWAIAANPGNRLHIEHPREAVVVALSNAPGLRLTLRPGLEPLLPDPQ